MRFNTLDEWLSWQTQLHLQSIDLGLDRIQTVFNRLCLDFSNTLCITVAGTNGKGSTIAMLNAIYQAAGYSGGTFTSPHFLHYNERIQIQSQPVSDERIIKAFDTIDQARRDVSLTYFEFSALAAWVIFADSELDVMITEVGLGGRLDAANVMDADCALVTSIDLDHQDWLGDTREAIGYEKAGVFRPNVPAICGDEYTPNSVRDYASAIGAQWFERNEQFDICLDDVNANWQFLSSHSALNDMKQLPLPALKAPVQVNNAATAICAIQALNDRLPVEERAIHDGLCTVQVAGRMQETYMDGVRVILDVAHNPAAAKALLKGMNQYHADSLESGALAIVIGMLADKDIVSTVRILDAMNAPWFTITPDNERAMQSNALADCIRKNSQHTVMSCQSMQQALDEAQTYLKHSLNDLTDSQIEPVLLVLGSFFTVKEAMVALGVRGV